LGIIDVYFDETNQLLILCIRQILERKREYNEAVKQLFIDFKKSYNSVRREVLYNILVQFGISMKLVRLIKVCLNETFSTVRVGKDLSDMLRIRNCLKQGEALSSLLFNFALQYAIRKDQVKQGGPKFSGTQQFLTYAYDVNISGGSVNTTNKNTEALLVRSKEIGLEVNVDKTMYMVMSRD